MSQFIAPRKSLGQNFLQDPNIIDKVVRALNVQQGDTVLEIGPGRGALTQPLLSLAGTLHLVEFDYDLVAFWQDRAAELVSGKLFVHSSDILKFDLRRELTLDKGIRLKVIGNLPYNISSPVLFHLMRYADMIEYQVVMLQKEVVERMAAAPGNKQFGRLSVMLQYRYQIEHLFNVPPGAFFPPPKVDSAIARLTPHQQIALPATSEVDLALVVKQAFSQRRKTLRNTLKGLLDTAQIESVDVDPGARAETLSVNNFVRLANLYSDIKP